VSAGRRSIALTLTSAVARAGEIGETDPSRHPPGRHTGRPTFMMPSRSRATRLLRPPSLRLRRPIRVIRQIAPSSRGVPLPVRALRPCTVQGHARPGRATQVLPSVHRRPTALLGFNRYPSQVWSRSRVDTRRNRRG
jgi:hypothetical protein